MLCGGLAVFAISLMFCGSAGATSWIGPTEVPPMGNVAPPLSQETMFNGQVNGTWNQLKINVPCSEDGQSLIWNDAGGNFVCGAPAINVDLLTVLNGGSDAGAFMGSTRIGGELVAGWLHATGTGWNTFMGNVSIGNHNPSFYEVSNATLFVSSPDPAKNAEIDIQTGSSIGGHWAIYNEVVNSGGAGDLNELRIWKGASNKFVISDAGHAYVENNMYAKDFCRYGEGAVPGQCLNDIINSLGVQFMGLTAIAYDGDRGGYSNVNAACGAGNHVCTSNDMLVVNRNPAIFDGITDKYAWIATGVAGFKDNYLVNDCGGWTSKSVDAYGSIWKIKDETTGGSVWITQCKNLNKIACCK